MIIMLNMREAASESEEYPPYWESTNGGSGVNRYALRVCNEVRVPVASCTMRELCLTFQDRPLQLLHLAVDNWADQKTPDRETFLALLRLVDRILRQAKPGPHQIVVHCAGGIGRSAVFVAVDSMSRALAAGLKEVSPDRTMAHLRPRRANMLQSPDQYVFVHETLCLAIEAQAAADAADTDDPQNTACGH